jgi:hypothetical protein
MGCPVCGRAVGTYVGVDGEPRFNRHGHRNMLGLGGGGCDGQSLTLAAATERAGIRTAARRAARNPYAIGGAK